MWDRGTGLAEGWVREQVGSGKWREIPDLPEKRGNIDSSMVSQQKGKGDKRRWPWRAILSSCDTEQACPSIHAESCLTTGR